MFLFNFAAWKYHFLPGWCSNFHDPIITVSSTKIQYIYFFSIGTGSLINLQVPDIHLHERSVVCSGLVIIGTWSISWFVWWGDRRERLITAFPPISVPQAGHELNRSDVTFIIRPLGTDLQIAHNNYCCQVGGLWRYK